MIDKDLVRRLARLSPPSGGCGNRAFHDGWHVITEDIDTGELPARPTCPSCGMEAENVIEIVYEKAGWRRLNDTPAMRRTRLEW